MNASSFNESNEDFALTTIGSTLNSVLAAFALVRNNDAMIVKRTGEFMSFFISLGHDQGTSKDP